MNAYTVMFNTKTGSVVKVITGRFGIHDLEWVLKHFHPDCTNLKVLI